MTSLDNLMKHSSLLFGLNHNEYRLNAQYLGERLSLISGEFINGPASLLTILIVT